MHHLFHTIVVAIVVHIGGLQIDHDVRTVSIASDCAPGAYCQTLPSLISLPIGGQFANTNFTCWGDSIMIPAALLFEPQSPSSYSLGFYNQTGLLLTAGTGVPFSFNCDGLSGT